MTHPVGVFVALWTLGIFALTGGRLLTRLRWRKDVPEFRRDLGVMELALHPGKYAVREALPAIRSLTAAGAILMAMGLAILVRALVSADWGR